MRAIAHAYAWIASRDIILRAMGGKVTKVGHATVDNEGYAHIEFEAQLPGRVEMGQVKFTL